MIFLGLIFGGILLLMAIMELFLGDSRGIASGCLLFIVGLLFLIGFFVVVDHFGIEYELNILWEAYIYISFWDLMTDDPLAKSQGFQLMIHIFSLIMLLVLVGYFFAKWDDKESKVWKAVGYIVGAYAYPNILFLMGRCAWALLMIILN